MPEAACVMRVHVVMRCVEMRRWRSRCLNQRRAVWAVRVKRPMP